MNRSLRLGLVVLLAGLTGIVRNATAAEVREGLTPLRGGVVRPHVVDFNALPRITTPYTGPILERPEAVFEEAEAELERLKQHPLDIRPAHLTVDASGGGNQTMAPVIGNAFEGITQGSYIPGEPTAAAGPLNIFTAGNVSVTVTNKDGTNRVETNGASFFGAPPVEGAISDAQCYYDAVHGRFVALAFTQGTSPTSYSNFYLAVSRTNDARGLWWTYKFDMTKDGTNPTANWADYHSLGISEDKLAMTSQQFRFVDNQYVYQKIRIIDRALAYTGAPVTYVDFVQFSAPSHQWQDVFVTKAARNLTPGDSTIHCLCVRTNGGSNVTYRTVTGPPAEPVLSGGDIVTVSSYGAPPDAVQQGSSSLVVTNDCRPPDFYVRDGVLTIAWHGGFTIGSSVVCAIRLLRLRTSDRVVLTDETYGAPNTYYYYPAVTVDSLGTLFLGFGRSSSTEYPSAWATGRRRTDATLEASALLKSGLAPNAQPRWGDYTGIDNDASLAGPGGSTAWYAGLWTKSSFSFGTWINRLTFTYGRISGVVTDDCDGSLGTTGDRGGAPGATVTLFQGATPLDTTTTDASGNYLFGYLETGLYHVVVTPPAAALDAVPGTGGTSQTRLSASDLQVDLTNAQTSVSNNFIVTSVHPAPVTTSISPASRVVGSGAFTLTVSGSSFVRCSAVQLDGSPRSTTYVNAGQLTASIPASDQVNPAIHTITVVTPGPGGGTSNGQTFTVRTGTDVTPPTVSLGSPVGGESWPVASIHTITWSAADNVVVANVDLDYSTNGGASFPFVIAHGIPNSGSYVWTVAGTPSTTTRVRVLARDADGNFASDSSDANFTISGWTITASAGPNGSISPSGAVGVPDGATPAFTITPNVGYSVAGVLVNGVPMGAVTSYTFAPVHSNQTIAATFTINQYTLNVTVAGNGSVTKVPDQPLYDHGTNVQLTAVPAGGSSFQNWSGDASGSANPITVTMTSNKNVTATFYQHIYTWSASGTAAWGTASNWSPIRSVLAADDVLQFTAGNSVIVTGVPTQTIGRLIVANGTTVTLQTTAGTTLTIAGGDGVDLDVQAGSTLRYSGVSPVRMALGAAATGSIGGTVDVPSGSHRLTALGTQALEFRSGAVLSLGSSFTGSIFGTGTGTSAMNSVVFRAGSLLAQAGGNTPFGAASPNAVLVFEHGSRFRVDGLAISLDVDGRTYADFEHNSTASTNATAANPCTLDSLIVSHGTLSLGLFGGGTIRGNINVQAGATLNLNPSQPMVLTLAGASSQTINAEGNLNTTASVEVVVNNPSGIVLTTNLTMAGSLTFVSGRVSTGTNLLALTSGVVTGASQSDGYVDGNLRLGFPVGESTQLFHIGDAANYTPVTVTIHDVSSPVDVTVSTRTPDYPDLGNAGLDPTKSVNRYWTLTASDNTLFTSSDVTLAYRPSNMDAAADPNSFLVAVFNFGWHSTTIGARTPTSTQALAVPMFGDFVVADPPSYVLTTNVVGHGSVIRSPNQPSYLPGIQVQLVALPDSGAHFSGWSGDVNSVANPISVQMNSNVSVTATFADVTGVGGEPVGEVSLQTPWPNPLRGRGALRFALPAEARVRLSVLDLQGREVLLAAHGWAPAGRHEVALDGGRGGLAPGLYFARLEVDGRTWVRRFVVAH